MRIGLFSDTYPPYINGVSTVVETTKRALEKAGHEVYVITSNPDNLTYKYEENDHIIRIPGVPTWIYGYRLTTIYPVKIINRIKRLNLDVIHSHTEFGVGTFARIFAQQFDVPLVHTYHTMYEDYVHYFTKGYFDNVGKKVVEYLTKFYCDKTATELIVLSNKSYDLFRKKYKVDRDLHIIPSGVEVERFYQERFKKVDTETLKVELGFNKDDFVILFVGRIAKEKSINLLIEAQASIIKKYPHCKLMIIGDGPDKEKLERLVNRLKIEENVLFTGKIPWSEIPAYYQIPNVFATASRSETQGLTVVEAMAASKPVLCADDDNFKEVVVEDLNGHLFKSKKEYKRALIELLENKEKLSFLSKQARITADHHSTKFYAEKLLYVYEKAISKHGGPVKKTFWQRFRQNLFKGIRRRKNGS